MSWTFTLPGQPPSLNDLYEIGYRYDRRGRRYKGIVKNEDARLYHDGAIPQIRAAKPSRWAPVGQVRLRIRLFLANDIDADNTLKVLSDAIQAATGINDKVFLPCIESKVIGLPPREARVEVEVEDLSGLPSPVPESSIPPLPALSSASSSASASRSR
jgi:hypothetical protein